MSENQKLLITNPSDSMTVSDIKPGKQGLNSRLRPILWGGGVSVLTHYLITWLETDGQLGTCDGSSGRPGELLEISFPTKIAVRLTKIYTLFLWLGKTNIADTNTGDTIISRCSYAYHQGTHCKSSVMQNKSSSKKLCTWLTFFLGPEDLHLLIGGLLPPQLASHETQQEE